MKKVRAVIGRRPDEKLVLLEQRLSGTTSGDERGREIEESWFVENVVAVRLLFSDSRCVIEIERTLVAESAQRLYVAAIDVTALDDEAGCVPCAHERDAARRMEIELLESCDRRGGQFHDVTRRHLHPPREDEKLLATSVAALEKLDLHPA